MEDTKLAMIANDIKNKEILKLKNFIADSYSTLVTDVYKAYIPETVFVEYFLDFFKSNGQVDATAPLFLKWIELAGGPYNEVTVIDASANELYTVPSIYTKPIINDAKSDGVNFNNIASEYNLRSNRVLEDGTNYLNNQLSGVDSVVDSDTSSSVNIWKAIFSRYDKSVSENTVIKDKVKPALSTLNNMLDYD